MQHQDHGVVTQREIDLGARCSPARSRRSFGITTWPLAPTREVIPGEYNGVAADTSSHRHTSRRPLHAAAFARVGQHKDECDRPGDEQRGGGDRRARDRRRPRHATPPRPPQPDERPRREQPPQPSVEMQTERRERGDDASDAALAAITRGRNERDACRRRAACQRIRTICAGVRLAPRVTRTRMKPSLARARRCTTWRIDLPETPTSGSTPSCASL